ncbi:MAG: CPBP family intramembrane metalloprotease [Acidobacteria bacterium]|nr:CPBP family intramembrane metalloprotease [Acidobacteriota bacterium]
MTDANSKNQPRVVGILVLAVAGFLLGQILASLLDAVLVSVTHFRGGMTALAQLDRPPWWSNVVGLGGLWVGFAAAIYLATRRGGLPAWPDAWRVRRFDAAYLGLGVAAQVVLGVAYAPFHFKNMSGPVNHLFGAAHGAAFALLAAMTVLGAPLVEEWLFRGVIFRALDVGLTARAGRRGTVAAVGLSALIFAAAHGEWLQLPGLFFLGVVLAVVVLRTRRLLPSVLTHVGFNALTMTSLVLQRLHH